LVSSSVRNLVVGQVHLRLDMGHPNVGHFGEAGAACVLEMSNVGMSSQLDARFLFRRFLRVRFDTFSCAASVVLLTNEFVKLPRRMKLHLEILSPRRSKNLRVVDR